MVIKYERFDTPGKAFADILGPPIYRSTILLTSDFHVHTVDEIGWLRRKMIKLLLGFEVRDYPGGQ